MTSQDRKPALLPLPALLFLPLTLVPLPCLSQDESAISQKMTLGLFSSRGDYGASERTDIHYIPLSYELARFPWIVSLTVPWLALQGPGDVFLEAGNIGRPGSSPQDSISEAGQGDVIVTGTYQMDPLFNGFAFLDLSVQLKVPTADETRDLGTGEVDVSYQMDLYKTVDSTTLFTTLGYRRRGRTSLYDLENSLYFSLGGMRQVSTNTNLGLLYDYREAASSSAYESHELMPFISWDRGQGWNYMLYAIFGFTPGSADQALGAQISYSW
ncbi:MAG: hypothetical protein WD601_13560 [Pseudohongiellaceae bacterium]